MASNPSSPFHWHYDELEDKNFQVHGRALLLLLLTLFSLLIIITIFSLFLRWFYRYRRLPPTNTTSMSNTTPHTPTSPAPRSLGLDLSTIDSLPIFLHRSLATNTTTTKEESQCSICLCAFADEEKVKILPNCRHPYHPQCVDQWLSIQSSCPLCRSSIRVESFVS